MAAWGGAMISTKPGRPRRCSSAEFIGKASVREEIRQGEYGKTGALDWRWKMRGVIRGLPILTPTVKMVKPLGT
jgi:hypothetical protein